MKAVVGLLLLFAPSGSAWAYADTPARFTADTITAMQLFDQSCFTNKILLGKGQVETISWDQVPANLEMMNTYGNGGVFFRTTSKTQFIAITAGPSHTEQNVIDQRCAIASQQITAKEAVAAVRATYSYPQPIDIPVENGRAAKVMIGERGALLVIEAPHNWVILRRDEMLAGDWTADKQIRSEKKKLPSK